MLAYIEEAPSGQQDNECAKGKSNDVHIIGYLDLVKQLRARRECPQFSYEEVEAFGSITRLLMA